MAYIKCTKGTPEQFHRAVEQRIAELGGDHIELSTKIKADISTDDKMMSLYEYGDNYDTVDMEYDQFVDYLHDTYDNEYAQGAYEGSFDDYVEDVYEDTLDSYGIASATRIKAATGTPEEFLAEVENRIAELGGRDVMSSCDDDKDTIESMSVPAGFLDESDRAVSVDEVLEFLGNKGYDISNDGVRNYADAVAEYLDMSQMSGQTYTLDQWYKDTLQNYPVELDELAKVSAACNSCNIISDTESELSPDQLDLLWEIADRYVTSDPVSDDWNTEAEHEAQTISEELGVSLDEAKHLMITYLGFEPGTFDSILSANEEISEVTYETVEAADDVEEVEDINKDEYLEKIEAELDSWAEDDELKNKVESMVYETDNDNLYITCTLVADPNDNADIFNYTVPFEDLSFNDINKDTEYIMEAVSADISGVDTIAESIDVLDSIQDDYDDNDEWEQVAHKSVPDSDGFYTDYTMYVNSDGTYICMFGDNDLYRPDIDYADFETDSKDEAFEWFENYNGFADDDDIIDI